LKVQSGSFYCVIIASGRSRTHQNSRNSLLLNRLALELFGNLCALNHGKQEGLQMAQLAGNYDQRQEFWKPAIQVKEESRVSQDSGQVCGRCGADFLMGSRFCHICGADRHEHLTSSGITGVRRWLDFISIRNAIGQSTGSLVAFILGLICTVAAVVTGFIYTATTVLDWQAVQIWRIEWLLAALAMFAAGILLKKTK
jgi:hypothetical protein